MKIDDYINEVTFYDDLERNINTTLYRGPLDKDSWERYRRRARAIDIVICRQGLFHRTAHWFMNSGGYWCYQKPGEYAFHIMENKSGPAAPYKFHVIKRQVNYWKRKFGR